MSSSSSIAWQTVPGSGNFCLLTDTPLEAVIRRIERQGVAIIDGPRETVGATGRILSVYFNDPDGNLVEVSNRLYSKSTGTLEELHFGDETGDCIPMGPCGRSHVGMEAEHPADTGHTLQSGSIIE